MVTSPAKLSGPRAFQSGQRRTIAIAYPSPHDQWMRAPMVPIEELLEAERSTEQYN
jgi:hypothetical protein